MCRLFDLRAKDSNHFEVRRAETITTQSAQQALSKYETYGTKLSEDGMTVTSHKVNGLGLEMLEVWDSGKGSICRV